MPTFAFNLKGWHPRQVAERLVEEDIYVWNGNYYNLGNHRALGLETSDGMVRVGQVHYNTMEEVRRLGEALGRRMYVE